MNQLNLTTSEIRILQTLVGSRITQLREITSAGQPDTLEGRATQQANMNYLHELIGLYSTLDHANPI